MGFLPKIPSFIQKFHYLLLIFKAFEMKIYIYVENIIINSLAISYLLK